MFEFMTREQLKIRAKLKIYYSPTEAKTHRGRQIFNTVEMNLDVTEHIAVL